MPGAAFPAESLCRRGPLEAWGPRFEGSALGLHPSWAAVPLLSRLLASAAVQRPLAGAVLPLERRRDQGMGVAAWSEREGKLAAAALCLFPEETQQPERTVVQLALWRLKLPAGTVPAAPALLAVASAQAWHFECSGRFLAQAQDLQTAPPCTCLVPGMKQRVQTDEREASPCLCPCHQRPCWRR